MKKRNKVNFEKLKIENCSIEPDDLGKIACMKHAEWLIDDYVPSIIKDKDD